ncbi:MAG: Gfo/Idh/MocA family oxidoreductase [Cyclobacteriaceae bacterium]
MDNVINWGIIGCGDVCEVKSGPAFNKVPNSKLVAVMRRDLDKSKDYALRHNVSKAYSEAQHLIEDPEVTAIYIATPPASHEEYAIRSINEGKPVYIEKPLSINSESTRRILETAQTKNVKAVGAYYRRSLPLFIKVKELIDQNVLGKIDSININLLQSRFYDHIAKTESNWRLDSEISGGGLFHDLAPHMLDIIYWIFGKPLEVIGGSENRGEYSKVSDYTFLRASFQKGERLEGVWDFNFTEGFQQDTCLITGENGYIKFSFFALNPLEICINDQAHEKMEFQNPQNIQLNMISDVVKYFLNKGTNPCSISDALVSMEMIDATVN